MRALNLAIALLTILPAIVLYGAGLALAFPATFTLAPIAYAAIAFCLCLFGLIAALNYRYIYI